MTGEETTNQGPCDCCGACADCSCCDIPDDLCLRIKNLRLNSTECIISEAVYPLIKISDPTPPAGLPTTYWRNYDGVDLYSTVGPECDFLGTFAYVYCDDGVLKLRLNGFGEGPVTEPERFTFTLYDPDTPAGNAFQCDPFFVLAAGTETPPLGTPNINFDTAVIGAGTCDDDDDFPGDDGEECCEDWEDDEVWPDTFHLRLQAFGCDGVDESVRWYELHRGEVIACFGAGLPDDIWNGNFLDPTLYAATGLIAAELIRFVDGLGGPKRCALALATGDILPYPNDCANRVLHYSTTDPSVNCNPLATDLFASGMIYEIGDCYVVASLHRSMGA